MAEEGASLSSGSLRLYALAQPAQGRKPLLVGAVDLYAYDPLNRRAAVGIMVATEHRRQGYALAMLQALEKLYSIPHNAPLGQGSCRVATEGWSVCSTPSPLRGTPPDPGGESEPAHNAPLGQGATEGWSACSTPSPLRGTPPDPGGESEPAHNAPLGQGSCREAIEGWMPSLLHTLYADIAATNSASLALFRKAGYTVCGHFKDWLAITPLRPAATSPESGEELKDAPNSDKNFPEGHAILNSPPCQGGVPRRGEGVESSVHPSVASRQLPCPRGASVGSPDSPPCQGEGGINHEGNTTYIDTIRMQLILK